MVALAPTRTRARLGVLGDAGDFVSDDTREWTKFGRYALLQKIGAGGMAEIYRAKTFGAAGFEKEFAIKLILPSLIDDTEFVDMFINEAKLTVNLYHANIVQVFDLGEIDNQYYIAMEYVHGKDLLDILARCAEKNIKIPLDIVLFIAQEVLKGLDFAHRAKDPYGEELDIIHRDVSPSNIMISYAGDVKVGDFGVAKAAIQRSLTETGTLKGKVGYMSPEQVMGEKIDSRSDLFSASIVLFEALSMNRLFVGQSDLDVMLKVRDADIDQALQSTGPLPSDLAGLLKQGLAKHREDRFQTGGEFYQALVDFCFQHSIKITGSDLSNFMRRLFAEEIEEEKAQRRSEPSGQTLSQEMLAASRAPEESDEFSDAYREPDSDPEETESAPRFRKLRSSPGRSKPDDTARLSDVEHSSPQPNKGRQNHSAASHLRGLAVSSTHNGDDDTGDGSSYRYRDDSGLVFGPMGQRTLVNLLRVRRPHHSDEVSVEGGPWTTIDDFDDFDLSDPASQSAPDSSASTPEPSSPNVGDALSSGSGILRPRDPVGLDESSTEIEPPPAMGDAPTEPSEPSEEPLPESNTPTKPPRRSLQELKAQYASYEGQFQEVPFARIFARLYLAQETGRLHVQRGDIEKSIFVRNGEPIFVQSNRDEELLGHFLRSRDLITEEQLQEGLERLSEWGGRLGDALVAIGAIPAHSIFEHLSAQMREKLLEIFTWSNGHYGYFENQEPEAQAYSLGVDTPDILVEGCRERISIDRIRKKYDRRTFVSIFVNTPPPFDIDALGLRARELRVLNQLKSGDTLERLLNKFDPLQHEMVYRTLYLFHHVEVIRFEVTGKYELPPLPTP